jgi:hypothetical protein
VEYFSINKKYEARVWYTTTILLTAGIRESHHVLLRLNILVRQQNHKNLSVFEHEQYERGNADISCRQYFLCPPVNSLLLSARQTTSIVYCLFPVKPRISPYINRLTLNLHITTRYHFQFEAITPIKINWNEDYTCSKKKKVRMRTHCMNFIN